MTRFKDFAMLVHQVFYQLGKLVCAGEASCYETLQEIHSIQTK